MKREARLLPFAVALALALGAARPSLAADRWEEAASGAVAILPAPSQARGITGGSLYCAEQKWAFLLRTDSATTFNQPVKIGVEGQTLTLHAVETRGTLQVAVPTEILGPLKTGSRMRVAVGDDKPPAAEAIFSLRNSSRVIEAIAPRCSPIDMSAYQAVALLETGAASEKARELFADEIKLFRGATGKQPTVAAIQIDRPEGKRLLFGSLCGSTSYYGVSGCTMAGWASTGVGAEWQPVYATDGVRLYLDETRSHDGWPGLATVAMVNGTEVTHWRWADGAYGAEGGELLADDETVSREGTTQ